MRNFKRQLVWQHLKDCRVLTLPSRQKKKANLHQTFAGGICPGGWAHTILCSWRKVQQGLDSRVHLCSVCVTRSIIEPWCPVKTGSDVAENDRDGKTVWVQIDLCRRKVETPTYSFVAFVNLCKIIFLYNHCRITLISTALCIKASVNVST